MKVTLRDVANQAGVSVSTASRALNNYPYVDETTRSSVWQAVRMLSYPLENLRRPTSVTRFVLILARYDTGLTQPISANDGDGFKVSGEFEQLVSSGAQSVFEEADLLTRLQHCSMRQSEMNMVWSYMDEPGLTGLILLGGILDQNFIRGLQELGLPFVIAGAHVKPLQANCVMADIIDGMQQAVNHLVATGRRQITLVNGPKTTTTSTEKYYGFRLALSLHDLPFSPEQVSTGEGDFKAESGYTQTLNILAQKPNLDAIIYADDAMAIGGLHALKENGRCVPEDVAVIGFHDYDLTRFTDPPLASVHFDMAMVGRLAARRLCTLINKPDHDPWLILVPMSLKIRKST